MKPLMSHDIYGSSEEFHNRMKDRMKVSHYKYGDVNKNYPYPVNAIKCLNERLSLYLRTGNTEWLVDVANFAMIEALYPSHSKAHYRATSADESPGLAKDMEDI